MLRAVLCLPILCFVGFINCTLPDYIKPCKANDPEISKCIINTINELLPQLQKGIPELDVPPIEPLHLDAIRITRGFQANLTDVQVSGGSMFEIIELQADVPNNQYRYTVRLPFMHFQGHYEMNTRLMLVNVSGSGSISGNFTEYKFKAQLNGKPIQQNGEEYLRFDKMNLTILRGQTTMAIDNLFRGNRVMTELLNDVLNDSIDDVFDVICPALTEALSELFTNITNKITLRFKYSELFL